LVAVDDATMSFLRKLPLFKKARLIYPTYAALYSNNDYEKSYRIKELIEKKPCIFKYHYNDKGRALI
jgi:hypothetical protein